MKTKINDLSNTRKNMAIEIPSSEVDSKIDLLTQKYSRSVRMPGFRRGKAPAKLIQRRMRDQILNEVAHDLIPKAIEDALREQKLQPVDTPSIRDVNIEEGQPLKFTATFEVLPPIDPGEYRGLTLRQTPLEVTDDDVSKAIEQLRLRSAKSEPVTERGVIKGDIVQVDLTQQVMHQDEDSDSPTPEPEHHESVEIEVGSPTNPLDFDNHLLNLTVGMSHEFSLAYPESHAVKELAGANVHYKVTVKSIVKRVLPDLNDEFASNFGNFETIDILKDHIRKDLDEQAKKEMHRRTRDELLKQLAMRTEGDIPETLVNFEIDRRIEHLVANLISQQIDPRQANIDWEAFRKEQHKPATDTVRSTLVLDEIAQRETIEVSDDEFEQEITRLANNNSRTVSATRAQLDKEGKIGLLKVGLRRDKTIDFVLSHATIVTV